MTQHARVVLEDCRGALADLVDGIEGSLWRRRWFAALALLRAVGHVLEKVDASNEPAMGVAIRAWWKELKQSKASSPIFWEFIENLRNSAIKEYRLGADASSRLKMLRRPHVPPGRVRPRPGRTTRVHAYAVADGVFAGRDQRDVVAEAIRWWEQQLDRIDRDANGGAGAP
jgi:hypothetical protein